MDESIKRLKIFPLSSAPCRGVICLQNDCQRLRVNTILLLWFVGVVAGSAQCKRVQRGLCRHHYIDLYTTCVISVTNNVRKTKTIGPIKAEQRRRPSAARFSCLLKLIPIHNSTVQHEPSIFREFDNLCDLFSLSHEVDIALTGQNEPEGSFPKG